MISRENWEKLKATGKVPLDANGSHLLNKRKRLQSAEPEEAVEVIKVANHFHQNGNQHSTLGFKSNTNSAIRQRRVISFGFRNQQSSQNQKVSYHSI